MQRKKWILKQEKTIKANDMTHPEVVLISNKYDYSTDFIAVELRQRNICYIRINKDDLKNYDIEFDPVKQQLRGKFKKTSFIVTNDKLRSIYFRAPTFLRDIFQENLSEEEQLIRTQWTAFIRSLCVFDTAKWFNNPINIFQAEIKPYQLYIANKYDINVPKTIISNKTLDIDSPFIAIKSIDTAVINKGDTEGFVYTKIFERSKLKSERYTSPFFIQQGLIPKTDIRVTVVKNNAVAVKIFSEHKINEDWRKYKDSLQYAIIELPKNVERFCIEYVKKLKLNFGAIDLILHKGQYYFLEINPTGEWSWLQQHTGYRFDKLIVNSLIDE